MRDPSRIPLILKRVEQVWEQCPDWRIGQLLSNAVIETLDDRPRDDGAIARAVILCPDDALLVGLDRLEKRLVSIRSPQDV